MRIVIITILILISYLANAETIKGVVLDNSTKETLIGATIVIKENKKYGISGLDGSFIIKELKAGQYKLEVSYIGYKTQLIDIEIKQDNEPIKILMKPKVESLKGATIYASTTENTESSARRTEQNSNNIVSVISAQAIDISPDLDLASVVNRASSVSLERNDNSMGKTFAIIRGMSKRYNYTLINGIKIPSPDDKNRYVPLDIFPSDLVGRVEVTKSLTADMEGDAVGGVIDMIMKNAPDNFYVGANASIGYHSIFFDKDFETFNSDAIELKTPFQKYGADYSASQEDFTTDNINTIYKQFSPDYSATATIGNRFLNNKIGAIAAVSYNNSHKGTESIRLEPDLLIGTSLPKLTKMTERNYYSQVEQLALHAKLDYQISKNNEIRFYLARFTISENQLREMTSISILGSSNIFDSDRKTYETRYRRTEQRINNYTLQGSHRINGNHKIEWTLANSLARQDTPDEAYFVRITNLSLVQGQESILIAEDGDNNRTWRFNKDKDYSGKIDYTYSFESTNTANNIKLGGLYRHRNRYSFYNSYNFTPLPGIQSYGNNWQPDDPNLSYNTWESYVDIIFKVGNPSGTTTNEFNHRFIESLGAGYIQFTSLIKDKLEITTGLRYENSQWNYTLLAPRPSQEAEGERVFEDVLPNMHIKYVLNKKQNLRASYFYSIVRPGYYEILPYIDKNEDYIEIGNPEIKHTQAHNIDFRYENFFSKTDMLMLGAFYKQIINPIEYSRYDGTETWSNISGWVNMPNNFGTAVNYGFEFDLIKFIRQFGVRMNYTYTNSEITQSKQVKSRVDPNDPSSEIQTYTTTQTRPLQGQSKHIGNASILYKNSKRKIDAQLAFVYTGERISSVSNYLDNDEWESPYYTLSFSVQKKHKNFTFFVKTKNLLNTPYTVIIKQELREDNADFPLQGDLGDDYVIRQDIYKMSFNIGIKYKL